MITVNVGDTLLLGLGGKGDHLWVVLAQVPNFPDYLDRNLLVVNLTTKRDGCDTSCIIQRGEHPFIEHDTVVYYGDMRLLNRSTIEQDLFEKKISRHQRCSLALMQRIIDGAFVSQMTKRKFKTFLRAQPSNAQPSSAQPSSAQPSSAQPSSAQPSSAQPSSAQPPEKAIDKAAPN